MKAGRLCCVLVVGLLAVSAYGQELRWQPVSSSGTFSIDNNMGTPGTPSEILIPAGGVTVTLELKVSGWGEAPGAPLLGAYQGTLDSAASYSNGVGADIGPLNPLTEDGLFIDTARADFVYFGRTPLAAVFVGTLDYEMGSTCMGGFPPDPGIIQYGATLILDIPAAAKGTYEITLNPDSSKTFLNNDIAELIPGLVRTTGLVTIVTGQCCYNLGPAVACADGITEAECDALTDPGKQYLFYGGDNCTTRECPSCTDASQCNDLSDCTVDTCEAYVCVNTPTYNVLTECCDPNGAALTPIDDGLPCTEDVCDPDTGIVDHNALAAGTVCDDGNPCSIDDECDGTADPGACGGTFPGDAMIACTVLADCPTGWFCENEDMSSPMYGFCDCSLQTPLCIEFDGVCYEEGDPVIATVAIGAGSAIVTSGQFLMTYDPTCLDFVGIGPCEGDDQFLLEVDSWVDEVAGKIWYAVLAADDAMTPNEGTVGPYDMACIEFTKLGECDPCGMCFISENPYNTLLGDYHGANVPLDNCGCSDEIVLDGEVTIVCPEGADVNVDCGVVDAEVLWDPPYAEDECLGALDVVCIAEHDGGLPISQDMIMNGGNFPQGKTYFHCIAENECESTAECVWTVNVSDKQTLDVEVDLSPAVVPGALTRCIMFDLIYNCAAPQTVCAEVTFGPPYNFPNHGTATLDVDKGNFECIEARDPLHTLRSFSDIECDEVTGNWKVVFKGDPLIGGNWLVPGNLDFYQVGDNGPNHVDVLDFGVYMWQIGADYGTGNTECGEDCAYGSFPNADLNGDGIVDVDDFDLIDANFMAESKLGCCGYATAGASEPVLDISVKELIRDGRGELAAGDINNDGRLNLEDMALYAQGGVQIQKVRKQVR